MFNWVVLSIAFPLAGVLLNLALSRRLREPWPGVLATIMVAGAGIAAALTAGALAAEPEGSVITLGSWIAVGDLHVTWALRVDLLSTLMMLVVTLVGLLIHVYSIGYMRGDARFTRFFIYLNLFVAAMLLLVTADNLVVMFVGWESVGLCSYLLIGFWFDKTKGEGWRNSTAARKAFIVNRVGDLGLLLALFMIFWTFKTLAIEEVLEQAAHTLELGAPIATAMALLLLLGVAGKSAQLPLFLWLPDAMAGPTPASALIHAATMVTAGVYLIIRMQALFVLAPAAQMTAAAVGAVTALFGASAALAQTDIKRVLAFSTISQLGFMVTAAGIGSTSAGLFHLMTHACFKSLLFLAAGSVIHALKHHGRQADFDAQDMRFMGGLWRRMPWTFITYWAGALALIGLPPFSGFFSKDEILASAYEYHPAIFILLFAAAFLTALYVARQGLLIFAGRPRSKAAVAAAESERVMIWPLLILALFSAVGGALNLPGNGLLAHWWEESGLPVHEAGFNPTVAALAAAVALAGVGLAWALYGRGKADVSHADPLEKHLGRLFPGIQQGWGLDALSVKAVVYPFNRLGVALSRFDLNGIGGADRGLAHVVGLSAQRLSKIQTGYLNWNIAIMIVGIATVLLLVALWRTG